MATLFLVAVVDPTAMTTPVVVDPSSASAAALAASALAPGPRASTQPLLLPLHHLPSLLYRLLAKKTLDSG